MCMYNVHLYMHVKSINASQICLSSIFIHISCLFSSTSHTYMYITPTNIHTVLHLPVGVVESGTVHSATFEGTEDGGGWAATACVSKVIFICTTYRVMIRHHVFLDVFVVPVNK